MATMKVTMEGKTTGPDGVAVPTKFEGELWFTDLEVGGGPIIPGDEHPPIDPPVDPPAENTPPQWIPVWAGPPLGWIVVPGFPAPAPTSKVTKR